VDHFGNVRVSISNTIRVILCPANALARKGFELAWPIGAERFNRLIAAFPMAARSTKMVELKQLWATQWT
jgi:hypothetical protein